MQNGVLEFRHNTLTVMSSTITLISNMNVNIIFSLSEYDKISSFLNISKCVGIFHFLTCMHRIIN